METSDEPVEDGFRDLMRRRSRLAHWKIVVLMALEHRQVVMVVVERRKEGRRGRRTCWVGRGWLGRQRRGPRTALDRVEFGSGKSRDLTWVDGSCEGRGGEKIEGRKEGGESWD